MREWTLDLHDSFFVKAEDQLMPQLTAQYKTQFNRPSQDELAKWDALDKPIWMILPLVSKLKASQGKRWFPII